MLPQLHAERQTAAIEAASVPHMSANSQREMLAKYRRLAAGGKQVARTLVEALGGVQIRRVEVPTKKRKGTRG